MRREDCVFPLPSMMSSNASGASPAIRSFVCGPYIHGYYQMGFNVGIRKATNTGTGWDISNWTVEGGVRFTFPKGTIVREQGYVVIAANSEALRQASGTENALGPLLGRLDNGGEELRLVNNSGRLMSQVDYGDRDEWPSAPDGSGSSLAKISPSSATHRAANWTFSTQPGGTPGDVNFAPAEAAIPDRWLPEQPFARALPLVSSGFND